MAKYFTILNGLNFCYMPKFQKWALLTGILSPFISTKIVFSQEKHPVKKQINQKPKVSTKKTKDLIALRNSQISKAIKIMKSDEGYSDFFVDDGRNPWHEAFTDVVNGKQFKPNEKFATMADSKARMDFVKKVAANDGYSDFFVDDGRNPWHEAFTDVVTGRSELINNAALRASSLKKISVLKSFNKIATQ